MKVRDQPNTASRLCRESGSSTTRQQKRESNVEAEPRDSSSTGQFSGPYLHHVLFQQFMSWWGGECAERKLGRPSKRSFSVFLFLVLLAFDIGPFFRKNNGTESRAKSCSCATPQSRFGGHDFFCPQSQPTLGTINPSRQTTTAFSFSLVENMVWYANDHGRQVRLGIGYSFILPTHDNPHAARQQPKLRSTQIFQPYDAELFSNKKKSICGVRKEENKLNRRSGGCLVFCLSAKQYPVVRDWVLTKVSSRTIRRLRVRCKFLCDKTDKPDQGPFSARLFSSSPPSPIRDVRWRWAHHQCACSVDLDWLAKKKSEELIMRRGWAVQYSSLDKN